MDILNNREIAIALWLVAISVYIFSSSKMAAVRNALKGVLAAFFVRQIMSALCLMIAYMAIVIYWLYELELWNFEQLKNTVFWCVSVGFISLFNLEKIKEDKFFFKHSVLDNLKLLAILQFILGVYTFSLWVEVLLVPILVLLGAMLAITETNRKHHQVRVILEYCLTAFGVVLIVYTLYMLMTNFGEFGQAKTAYDFFIPPMLTLLYLPFIFFMLVYSTYEQVFVRLRFSIKSRFHRYAAKLFAIILFNVRLSLLERWSFQVAKTNIKSYSDLIETFKYIFKVKYSEKNPKEVPKEQGWSPYKAKEFLVNEGLSTGFYNRFFEEEWFASSSMEEFSDGIIPDNIAYYVEGSEEVAKVLKLKVNVNDASRTHQACEKLEAVAEVLSMSSLNQPLSEEMKNAISGRNSYFEKVEDKTIALIVEHWPNHKFMGFDLKLLISSI
ncbi:hypothetical protein HL273_19840 [Yersinia enterocolitica]|uniref:hypothetical protein n=1 Tax=Yersinia enterocolitica TaxID=630 RepID=UPI00155B3803|nr:hypothetical protein [Yersinia enterocolitica]MBX9482028.1 hypothetical protein [Yersinia enterocolitica]NQS95333.1 hypothetical protein [Yersinia enterocolitica]NQT45522.1 hypothetical protein [Yersinia enterocolitica]NQU02427.1 hypothetical protein [Yersinia enterocolitica]HDM8448365.1 hypothetical protein [Yersinia enterocolitica]